MSTTRLMTMATAAVASVVLLFTTGGMAVADMAVGPGPTNYTVQPQPPSGTCHYRAAANGQTLPDPACTPGAINPKVTPDTLGTTVCRSGYTKSIRPPKGDHRSRKTGQRRGLQL